MYEINKNDPMISRGRSHVKEQVDRFRAYGRTEEEIINWIENDLETEIGLYNYFDSAGELAEFVNLPVSKFNNFWM